jgi:FtsP/CotA-like multicopper oxidase with cupredoxin domain
MAAAGFGLRPCVSAAESSDDGFQIIRARRSLAPLLGPGSPETETWSFGEKGLPLLIRARQGQEIRLRIVNELAFELWLHWFGVRGPSDLMTFNVPVGSSNSFDSVFTPPDAGTFWLGPMADVSRLRDMGLSMIVIDQHIGPLMNLADRHYILEKGRVVWQGGSDELRAQPQVLHRYVGV